MRALAKEWKGEADMFLTFPDEYYEITFLKCALVGALKYEEFIKRADRLVPLLDNWAICDCAISTMKTIGKNREAFLPYLRKCAADPREFVQRFAYVCLLSFYTDSEYFATEF